MSALAPESTAMKPPSAPKPDGLSKPEMTVSPPVPAPGQSVRRSRQSQVSPLQMSPHLPPGSRSQQQDAPHKTQLQEPLQRPLVKLPDGPRPRQPLLLSAGSRGGAGKGPEPLRRAIAECTGGTAAQAAGADRVVQEYLCKMASVDLAYSLLLEHALAEKGRSPGVVPKTVTLLKRYLFRYLPSGAMLEAIDAFCAQLMTEFNEAVAAKSRRSGLPPLLAPGAPPASSPLGGICKDSAAVMKSLTFLRAFVGRQMGPVSSARHQTVNSEEEKEFRGDSRAKVSGAPRQEAVSARVVELRKLRAREEGGFLESDLFGARWTLRSSGKGGKKQAAWAPSPVVLGSGGLSRPVPQPVRTLDDTGAATLLLHSTSPSTPTRSEADPGTASQLASDHFPLGQALPLDPDARSQDSAALPVADAALLATQIRTIAAAKRRPESSPRSSNELPKGAPAKRRARPLFNYRPYREQQPLKLSDTEIADVLGAVCSDVALGKPPDPGGAQAADVAASVLIKLLLDMYLAAPSLAGPLTLRLLLEMLSAGAPPVRCRAFDLALNLGVHAHLIEPAAMQPEEGPFGPEASSPGKAQPANGAPCRGAVAQFEEWVLGLVREMLLLLVQRGEREETVWAAGLSCLLYYTADQGQLCRRKLDGLDVRIPAALLAVSRRHCWAETVHTAIVRLAVHLLYPHAKGAASKRGDAGLNGVTAVGGQLGWHVPPLDLQPLERIGGVGWLCEEYGWGRSKEARRNVFAVLFDLAVLRYSQGCVEAGVEPPAEEDVCAVAVALALAKAPEAIALGFKLGSTEQGEAVRQAILSAMQRDVTAGRLNAELLSAVTSTLGELAASFSCPAPAFSKQVAATLAAHLPTSGSPLRPSPSRTSSGASITAEVPPLVAGSPWRRPSVVAASGEADALATSWGTLRALLHSPHVSDRTNGRCWLSEILSGGARGGGEMRAEAGSAGERLRAGLEWLRNQPAAPLHPDVTSSGLPGTPTRGGGDVSQGVQLLWELLHSPEGAVQALFLEVVDQVLLRVETEGLPTGVEGATQAGVGLLSEACQCIAEANSADTPTVLQMCQLMFRQLCARWPFPAPHDLPREGSLPALFLNGQLVAPLRLLCLLPVALLQWPLLRLPATPPEGVSLTAAVGSRGGSGPGSSLSDVRAAMLVLLITRCGGSSPAFEAVGPPFFHSVLDDPDPRLAYYVSTFLLRRMAAKQPDEYRAALQRLIFQAQQVPAVQCVQGKGNAAAGAPEGGQPEEIRVLFRMYEEDCRPTNSFMEFGITSDADIRRVLKLMQWTDAVDITPGSPAGGRLVTTMADLQPYGWYDRIETYLDLRRVQSRLKVAGHESNTPIQMERLLSDKLPDLELASRIFYTDQEQHKKWLDAQAELVELARKSEGEGDTVKVRALLRLQDSSLALKFDTVAISKTSATVVVADYAEVGSLTALEAVREKAEYLRQHPELAHIRVASVMPLLCVKGYDRGIGGRHGLLRYAQERDVLLAERSLTGTDSLVE